MFAALDLSKMQNGLSVESLFILCACEIFTSKHTPGICKFLSLFIAHMADVIKTVEQDSG